MGLSQATSAVLVFLAGLVPASCHKETQKTPAPAAVSSRFTNAVAVNSNERAIGKIALTNLDDTYVQFSSGETFTLTPKIGSDDNVQITLSVQSQNAYGATKNFAATQLVAEQGKPVNVAIGGYNVSFTPQVYPQPKAAKKN